MTTQIERDIRNHEDELTSATRSVDLHALDRLYADDIMFTGVAGQICDKASIMDEARRGAAERQRMKDAPAPSYEKDDVNVVVHGDTAVSSYRFVVTFRDEAKESARRFRTTNVWMKRPSGWQVVAAHTATIDLPAS